MSTLHDNSIIIDGLNISKFERSVFEDMRKGGVTAVNCTVSVWESFQKTVDNIAEMKQQIREVLKIADNNHMTFEWYENQGGQEKKTMEINYTRAGKK